MDSEDVSKETTSARKIINRHLWNFHNHAKCEGDTATRYVFHERLHAESPSGAGKPLHVHISDTDLNAIKVLDA